MLVVITLLGSLTIILASAELFTNGVEWLGKKLNLSEGAVGSILAAVGTALPESIIPVIAIVSGTGTESHEIGIGAILGAPFMLSTLAMALAGTAAIIFRHRDQERLEIQVNKRIILRDLSFFLPVYSLAIMAAFIPVIVIKYGISLLLISTYMFYVYKILRDDASMGDEELAPLYFRRKSTNLELSWVILQAAVALGSIILGAHLFVSAIEELAHMIDLPAFVLALIIVPIATELPEKFNSVIWIKNHKDTLALGNITGAMVFQSSIIPAFGISFTPWQLSPLALLSAVLALISTCSVFLLLKTRGRLHPLNLVTSGLFYLVFVGAIFKFH